MPEHCLESFLQSLAKGPVRACIVLQEGRAPLSYFASPSAQTALPPIHSCTKSILSMLVGICLHEKLLPSIHTPICNYFPDYAHCFTAEKRQITLAHLLTMTPGFDWPESGQWARGLPTEYSSDVIGFTLGRELIAPVGTQMNYNSGCSNLLGAILQTATGMKLMDFARETLFSPLGIHTVTWREKQGMNLGANGLCMQAADLAKLGQLALNQGWHNGKSLVPSAWMAEATAPRFLTYPHIGHYGYHWWCSEFTPSSGQAMPFYFALGLFGQALIVAPSHRLVAVFMGESYSNYLKPLQYFRQLLDCV